MRLSIILLLLTAAALGESTQSRPCTPAAEMERTHWEHEHVVLDLLNKPVKALQGTVRADGKEALEGVLVEIYEYGGDSPSPTPDNAGRQRRVAACVTGLKGEFAFDVPSGRYEVRASKSDWNSISVLVSVDKKRGHRRAITIPIRVGT